jgi:hypothetical protein
MCASSKGTMQSEMTRQASVSSTERLVSAMPDLSQIKETHSHQVFSIHTSAVPPIEISTCPNATVLE